MSQREINRIAELERKVAELEKQVAALIRLHSERQPKRAA
jgi:hypothetical protein